MMTCKRVIEYLRMGILPKEKEFRHKRNQFFVLSGPSLILKYERLLSTDNPLMGSNLRPLPLHLSLIFYSGLGAA